MAQRVILIDSISLSVLLLKVHSKAHWRVHPDPVSVSGPHTPIDVKDDTVVEHRAGLSTLSPLAVYPAGWLLPQTPDQCGTL